MTDFAYTVSCRLCGTPVAVARETFESGVAYCSRCGPAGQYSLLWLTGVPEVGDEAEPSRDQ